MGADVTAEVVVHRPRAVVAEHVLDPAGLARWRGQVTGVRRVGAGAPGPGARYRVRVAGRRVDTMRTDEVVDLVPLTRLALRTVDGGEPTTIEVTLAPEGTNSTLVRVRVHASPGGRAAWLAPWRARGLRRALAEHVARLKTWVELDR